MDHITQSAIGKITENTLVPVSLMLVLVGGVVWLSSIFYKTEANAQRLSSIENKYDIERDKFDKRYQDLIERLTRIEERIKMMGPADY